MAHSCRRRSFKSEVSEEKAMNGVSTQFEHWLWGLGLRLQFQLQGRGRVKVNSHRLT